MTGAGRLRRTAGAVLVFALLVAAAGTVIALQRDHHRDPSAAAPARSPAATTTAPAPAVPEPPSAPAPTAVAGAHLAPATSAAPDSGEAPSPPPSELPRIAGEVTAPAVAVSCRPDLALAASPDAPFSFLCTAGTTPVSWPNDTIRLFTSGLTPAQTAALPAAVAQWQSQARFDVTLVTSVSDANVVLTNAALSNNEDGYTSMHYMCEARCAYDHADVRLTSTAQLTKASWIATILHELGHVAGLNHVTRISEVMYPEIDAGSPVVYGSGDLAGFRELQAVRSA
jgi:hypothetical protein